MKKHFNSEYAANKVLWRKWRLAYEGGDAFIANFLKRFSKQESREDFLARKSMAYCPAFAKEALTDIRNAIFQRMTEVMRTGSESYLEACAGKNGGVDGKGTNMLQYIGNGVLDELLAMGKVALWIDSDADSPNPYVYMYAVEEILNWDDEDNPTSILLQDLNVSCDGDFGLQEKPKIEYRHARVVDEHVEVTFLDGKQDKIGDVAILDFDKLPIVILDIGESLMKDVANYQVALLNLASSDLSYALKANFTIYTEQYDLKADLMKKFTNSSEQTTTEIQGTESGSTSVGVTSGIRYPIGTERPSFISPSTDPLTASMAKQEQMKREIRTLVNLSLSNISPNRSSSESKQQDEKGLESGLAFIGQELEKAERAIAYFWHEYLSDETEWDVLYPTDYSLKSDDVRQSEADRLLESAKKIPSKTAQRALVKMALEKMFAGKVTASDLKKMREEIDSAEILYVDPDTLFKDLEAHLVSNEYASMLRGYPATEAAKAIADHTDKLARIAIAQSEASLIANQKSPGVPTLLSEKSKKQEV